MCSFLLVTATANPRQEDLGGVPPDRATYRRGPAIRPQRAGSIQEQND